MSGESIPRPVRAARVDLSVFDRPEPRWRAGRRVAASIVAAALTSLLVAYLVFGPAGPRRDAVFFADQSVPFADPALDPASGPLPAVEPVITLAIAPAEAREVNEQVPFSRAPNPAAAPFGFPGPAEDRARALDCLASAAWYEAGDDRIGQHAVAQVILNRARHPAFPKTVCGVVFQGSERTTGCQFTFTCDGALRRVPTTAAWARARAVASAALGGVVFAPVGYATHYHTDWVVPNWSAKLDKITAVDTHLFFRWRGGWGRPAAFRGRVTGAEPIVAKLGFLSESHRGGAPLLLPESPVVDPATAVLASPGAPGAASMAVPGVPVQALNGAVVRAQSGRAFMLQLDRDAFPGSYAVAAYRICRDQEACTVMGWLDAGAVPGADVSPAQAASMAFFYRRDSGGRETVLWDCARIRRDDRNQCLPADREALIGGRPARGG